MSEYGGLTIFWLLFLRDLTTRYMFSLSSLLSTLELYSWQ